MPAIIELFKDNDIDIYWDGSKGIYEIITDHIVDNSEMRSEIKEEFDYYRANHYIDFRVRSNEDFRDFWCAIRFLLKRVDSGYPEVRNRLFVLSSLGYLEQLIIRAMRRRQADFIQLFEGKEYP